MYQTVGHQIVVSYAECMGLPLFRRRIRGSTRHQHLNYTVTPDDEVEDMFILLNEVKKQIPSITAVSSGAIASDYQRLRVESVCSRLGLVSLAYLWKQDQSLLLQEMITNGIVAIIVKVAAMGLNPAKHLGREIAHLQPQLLQLNELYGINVCGEGGEYETLTLDCPLFTNARIVVNDFQVVRHSSDSIAPVGILHPSSFHLEYKKESTSFSNNGKPDSSSEKTGHVCEVEADSVSTSVLNCQSADLASDICTVMDAKLHTSRTKRDTFSICCWIQDPCGSSDRLEKDLTAVLKKIEAQLHGGGFDWVDVLYIHLYIANMNDFALANETYVSFITEKKCNLGVPSRSTIELPLTEVGLGKAYVEVLVANDRSKRVLHVQSISSWAPSCIGPYSQATLHKEILHMAGQLGLDPPTMLLRSGGALAEMQQALDNSEAVANCFNCSLASSAILFVIYCSASLTSSKRMEVQNKLEDFLTSYSQNGSMSKVLDPIFLYVLVPNLPKRALVEVKPVLYVPQDKETVTEAEEWKPDCSKILNCWGFEHSTWHDSCCQKSIIHGKICSIVVSVTNESAAMICSETGQNLADCRYFGTDKHMKRIARFCIYLLNKVLMDSDFSWSYLTNLRIYFTTSLCWTVDVLLGTFTEAFDECTEISRQFEMGKEHIFNLVPVLGSGRCASINDLITCELFASKL
ncbi:diphthine--ammonia ligase isoform X2 [Magnolia sinica]|nr:diphthine--ammonia ligase isoform X2 [Magnolia sinica]